MLDRVRDTIHTHGLLRPGEPLWVAVSGGVDSMVLLHVLRALGHPCHVAHVDHGLRGAESDADREFVREHCMRYGLPFAVQRVDVAGRTATTGESTQMAARELRLGWLNVLAAEGPHKVATAHHADDANETFFLGLFHGMGSKGWGSIPIRSGTFIRPLLGVSRAEIAAYAMANAITWREDSSNASDAYLRNRVRHELLPLVERWRPGVRRTMVRNMRMFGELSELAEEAGTRAMEGLRPEVDGTLRIPLERITGATPLLVLHHLLRGMGFHPDRFDDMLTAIRKARTGARFPGSGVEVFVDRSHLVIAPLSVGERSWVIHAVDETPADAPIHMRMVPSWDINPNMGRLVAWFDADRISFPLELRPWRAGDRLQLQGLAGTKLISDILIDAKVPLDHKRRTYVLADADRVIWLCGWRMCGQVKASPSSARILRADWMPDEVPSEECERVGDVR